MNPTTMLLASVVLLIVALPALPLRAQENGKKSAPAKEKPPEKLLLQLKAEQIIIPRLEFTNAEVGECIIYLRKKSEELDPAKDPKMRGLNFSFTADGGTKPVTLSLQNVSAWDATQKIAAAAGLEVSVTNRAVFLHPKGAGPAVKPKN